MKKKLFFSFLFLSLNLINQTCLGAAAPQQQNYLSVKPLRPLTSCRTTRNLLLLKDRPTQVRFEFNIGTLQENNHAYNQVVENVTTIAQYINGPDAKLDDITLKNAIKNTHTTVHLHPSIRSVITVKDNASPFKTSSAHKENWLFKESINLNIVFEQKNISDKDWNNVCEIIKDIPGAIYNNGKPYNNDKPAKRAYLTLATMASLKRNKRIGMQATLEI